MESVLIALLVSATPPALPAGNGVPAPLDLQCFQLMAELSEAEDPQVRNLSRVAAQYFLGRIDAAAPGFDVDSLPQAAPGNHDQLLGRCGDVLRAGGRDFRTIGDMLAPPARPVV